MAKTDIQTVLLGRKVMMTDDFKPDTYLTPPSGEIVSIMRDTNGDPMYTVLIGDGKLYECYDSLFRVKFDTLS